MISNDKFKNTKNYFYIENLLFVIIQIYNEIVI
jgi:hypothetical protein